MTIQANHPPTPPLRSALEACLLGSLGRREPSALPARPSPTDDGRDSLAAPPRSERRGGHSRGHDGNSIAYVTTDYSADGHLDATATVADIRTVPYKNRAGGTSKPLPGASDPNLLEYYPSYSGDDKLIAFTQAPKPGAASPDGPYYNRMGQVMIIPAAGGTATPSLRMSWRASSRRPRSKSLRWIRRWRTPAASCAPCPAVQTSLTLRGCLQRTSTAKPPSPVT
jgi:hypothetical protein